MQRAEYVAADRWGGQTSTLCWHISNTLRKKWISLDAEESLSAQTRKGEHFRTCAKSQCERLGKSLWVNCTPGAVGNKVLEKGGVQFVKITPPPQVPVLSTFSVQFNLILIVTSISQNRGLGSAGPHPGPSALMQWASIPIQKAGTLTLILNDRLPSICHAEESGLVHGAWGSFYLTRICFKEMTGLWQEWIMGWLSVTIHLTAELLNKIISNNGEAKLFSCLLFPPNTNPFLQ